MLVNFCLNCLKTKDNFIKIVLGAILPAVFLFITLSGSSQQAPGANLGNYAGVNSLQLNPSALHNSKSYLDIQFFGVDVFVQNNYLYMNKSDYRFTNLLKPGYILPSHLENYGTEQRIFYHTTNQNDKNGFFQNRINGPGAMLVLGHHAFAISTALRTIVSTQNVPYEIANFIYLGLNYRPQQNIEYLHNKPVRGSGMAWGEIGVSYSHTFFSRGFNVLSAGISLRRLFGLGGLYFEATQLDYTVLHDSTIEIKNLNGEIGFSLPADYSGQTVVTTPVIKGGGFAADFGITYTRLKQDHQNQYFNTLCEQLPEDYLYRIGVALIDIGGIRFRHNASKMIIDNRSASWNNLSDEDFEFSHQFLDSLSYKFYGDTISAWAGNHFTCWLPSSLSVQFDYHINKNWYINASLIHGFRMSKSSISRPTELSVTPRYETSWFEADLPVSLYNLQLVRIGFAVRIYGLTIGTDKLGGLFHIKDFTGLDFYMSLKLFLSKGKCRDFLSLQCPG